VVKTYIVVLTWNNSIDFERCVAALAISTDAPASLVIVDNGSEQLERDKIVVAFMQLYRATVQMGGAIYNEHNRGIPAAQNQALDMIERMNDEPYGIVLLDADTVVEPHWLTKLLDYAEAHPDVGIVGGAKSPGGYSHPVFHHTDGRWYVYDKQAEHPSGFMEGESVDFACAYLRPELMERGLRMDEGYELYDGHDQDMTFRVRSWGYRVVQVDAGVIHYGSAAMKANGYTWSGGGKQEWDQLRSKNLKRFVDIWEPFLAGRRHSVEEEIEHMKAMNAKLVAEAGDRSQTPGRGRQVP
jgi:GT2 family glycosyltransferase